MAILIRVNRETVRKLPKKSPSENTMTTGGKKWRQLKNRFKK